MRPARLPIPPSGRLSSVSLFPEDDAKVLLFSKPPNFALFFFKKKKMEEENKEAQRRADKEL
ncbi:MAG: hypothetical protein ACRC77_10555 [Bacteroidales bacterium]